MQKITPFLWFDNNAEEAINFYIEVFNGSPAKTQDSKIISIARYQEGMEAPNTAEMKGKVITAVFELNGQRFMALDGGPVFKFSEATSFFVECANQEEVDHFWNKLTEGGDVNSQQCGWLKDKFGLSWQIVPKQLGELMSDPDQEKVIRVTNAMLQMKKIDIAALQKAHDQK